MGVIRLLQRPLQSDTTVSDCASPSADRPARRSEQREVNGRWAVEAPWDGDECDWWIPDQAEDGSELTFATRAEANSFMYSHGRNGCRVVQLQRWSFTLPPQPPLRP